MEIPQGVNVKLEGQTISVKGQHGEVKKSFPIGIHIKADSKSVSVEVADKAIKGTVESVIKSMLHGAASGYTKNLKLLYAHFPITVEVKGSDILIKNFLGEKMPRKTVLIRNTKVVAKGQSVTISGPDKEAVGQTVANVKSAMKIKDKDGRVFQDGAYDAEG